MSTTQQPILDSRLRGFVGYNLKRAYLLVHHAALNALQDFALRPRSFSTLILICDNPDMSQSELARALEIKRSGVVLMVDELEQRGLIRRNAVPGDRRSYALRATLAGIKLAEQAATAVQARESALIAGFSETEQQWLRSLYQRFDSSEQSSTSQQSGAKRG